MGETMKKFIKIVIFVLVIFVVFIVGQIGGFLWEFSHIRTNKDYTCIMINNDELADYKVFVNCKDKYTDLKMIGVKNRTELANYMYENNLRLRTGKQEYIVVNPTYTELIEDFKFEKIDGKKHYKDYCENDAQKELFIPLNLEKGLNSRKLNRIINGKINDTCGITNLNEVVQYNLYNYMKENHVVIDKGNYDIGYDWWFYKGKFYYNEKEYSELKFK